MNANNPSLNLVSNLIKKFITYLLYSDIYMQLFHLSAFSDKTRHQLKLSIQSNTKTVSFSKKMKAIYWLMNFNEIFFVPRKINSAK